MKRVILSIGFVCAAFGCASTPEQIERREQAERDIAAILSEPAEASDYVEKERCLAGNQYRDFNPLDDKHILFEGSRGRLWINTLPMRCTDLRHAHVLRIRSTFSFGRICKHDTFQAGDWFDWPWYRRAPWRWTGSWHSGMTCTFGDFQPVTAAQVTALKEAIRSTRQ